MKLKICRPDVVFVIVSFAVLCVSPSKSSAIGQVVKRFEKPKSLVGLLGRMAFVVTKAEPRSPAEKGGLLAGDLLLTVNR